MGEEKKENPNSYDFPLNQGLLDDSLKLKEERRILKERLSKIEESRKEVSLSVYDKVHRDYENRLQGVNDRLLEKKQDIDRELSTLYETRDKIEENLKNHQHALEELQFRHKLGEFDKEEFRKASKGQEDKVKRFEQVAAGVKNNIKRYEGLFEGEEELFGTEPKASGTPLSEELITGEDEWEKEAESHSQKAQISPQNGGENQEWLEATRPNVSAQAKLTIISGKENVGKSFNIEGALTIGRSHTNQIILKDGKVSRQHAELKMHGSECVLIDLNSSNGTCVNGHKIHEQILAPNDEIQVGDFVLQFQQ